MEWCSWWKAVRLESPFKKKVFWVPFEPKRYKKKTMKLKLLISLKWGQWVSYCTFLLVQKSTKKRPHEYQPCSFVCRKAQRYSGHKKHGSHYCWISTAPWSQTVIEALVTEPVEVSKSPFDETFFIDRACNCIMHRFDPCRVGSVAVCFFYSDSIPTGLFAVPLIAERNISYMESK